MKTYLAAAALAAALAQPAAAVTFPTLTTIYVVSGVYDSGGAADTGVATIGTCSNVSGQTASLRLLFLSSQGTVIDSDTTTLSHGTTSQFATRGTFLGEFVIGVPVVHGGVLNIESTQSGVFCSVSLINAAGPMGGVPLHMVRVNNHPGTVE